MTTSILLDRTTWDYVLDANGNWAVCSDPYSTAQDVSCAVRTFQGEVWFDASVGVPYLTQMLGQFPSLQLAKALIVQAAATVAAALSPICYLVYAGGRQLIGQVQATDAASGQTVVIPAAPWPSPNSFTTGASILGGLDVI